MDNPLVIIGSARKDGNTQRIVDFVFNSKPYDRFDLLTAQIFPYNYEDQYPASDQFEELVGLMLSHQVIIFATPIYWYAMSGLMKTFFDRITELVTTKKEIGRALKGKTVSLIISGTDPELPDGFEMPFKLTANYLEMDYRARIYFTEDQKILDQEKLIEIESFLARLQKISSG